MLRYSYRAGSLEPVRILALFLAPAQRPAPGFLVRNLSHSVAFSSVRAPHPIANPKRCPRHAANDCLTFEAPRPPPGAFFHGTVQRAAIVRKYLINLPVRSILQWTRQLLVLIKMPCGGGSPQKL
jgi:hypothetical protein